MKQTGKKEKRIKRNEDNFRDLWDNVKRPNIRIIGVPEEEDKKKNHEKILEEIIVENFPKMGKEIIIQVPSPAGYSSLSSSYLYCCVWGGLSVFWQFVEFPRCGLGCTGGLSRFPG